MLLPSSSLDLYCWKLERQYHWLSAKLWCITNGIATNILQAIFLRLDHETVVYTLYFTAPLLLSNLWYKWHLSGQYNSHIRHSHVGRALLRSRTECGRLWVLLGSAVQAGPPTQSGMCIDSYQFLPEISSFVITCTYPFTTDDNHRQKSTILSSVICHYTGHQQ